MRQVVDGASATHLLIVGDGPLRKEILAQVDALGLSSHVTLAGWRRDMPEIYAASDLFVLTTWGWEGLPLTVLEAMAAGKPIVASRAGGIPEIVVEKETGLLVEPQDAAALAVALTRLVVDVPFREQAGVAGLLRAESHFDLRTMVENSAKVYTQVLAADSHKS
jgi:glycosyltransferase involved in cell wall biosynthesis